MEAGITDFPSQRNQAGDQDILMKEQERNQEIIRDHRASNEFEKKNSNPDLAIKTIFEVPEEKHEKVQVQ